MKTESGRFTLTTQVGRARSVVKQQVACSEVDDIARRRARRTSETATDSTHVSLSEAMARQRQREVLGL
ncbi:MAG: hypothetical protein HOP32_15350 [Nitrospira sp.]|nr:hypothetical protein [Nitrospira sp.]